MSPEKQSEPARVLFLNRSYWPDEEATGQLLTELCEDLAGTFDVTVIADRPRGAPADAEYHRCAKDIRRGVRIRRVRTTRFSKRSLTGRIINYLSFLAGAFWAALWVKRPAVVVVETDPPLLCLIGWYLQRVRHTKLVICLQDIHPDIAIALGKLTDGVMLRALRRLIVHTYRRADCVTVLSRDMRQRIIEAGVEPRRVVCIPNWADTTVVRPIKRDNPFRTQHGLDGHFIAMYSGNLGSVPTSGGRDCRGRSSSRPHRHPFPADWPGCIEGAIGATGRGNGPDERPLPPVSGKVGAGREP